MKKLICLLVLFSMFSSIAFAESSLEEVSLPESNLENGRIILYEDENESVYTFENLNPIWEAEGCSGLYTPNEAFHCLLGRGVPVEHSEIKLLDVRRFMVITLANGESYGLDILETRDVKRFVLEETVRQFCLHYFGEDYDFYHFEPDF